MENALRGIATGLIFHFLAGFITAGTWRLTSVRGAPTVKCERDESSMFSEVMIWPVYLIIMFCRLIKSLVDLILKIGNYLLQFSKKWKEKNMQWLSERRTDEEKT